MAMYALSENQMQFAKNRAIAHLERSIVSISAVLGIDPDQIDSNFEIPVNESHAAYQAYVCLVNQIAALSKLV